MLAGRIALSVFPTAPMQTAVDAESQMDGRATVQRHCAYADSGVHSSSVKHGKGWDNICHVMMAKVEVEVILPEMQSCLADATAY